MCHNRDNKQLLVFSHSAFLPNSVVRSQNMRHLFEYMVLYVCFLGVEKRLAGREVYAVVLGDLYGPLGDYKTDNDLPAIRCKLPDILAIRRR